MFNTYPANPWPRGTDNLGDKSEPYTLPVASAETLGGVMIGDNLDITDGVLSAPAPYTPLSYSTTEQNTGTKWIDGKDIYAKVLHFETRQVLNAYENRDIVSIDNIDFVQAWAVDYGQKFVQNQLQIGIDLGKLYIFNAANKTIGITDLVMFYTKPTT